MKDRIRELRVKSKMNQTKLGELLNVSQDTISKIEKGINNPTVSQIATLSKIFNVSTDYLLFGIESTRDITPTEYNFLRLIRDDKTVFGKLLKMLEARNEFDLIIA